MIKVDQDLDKSSKVIFFKFLIYIFMFHFQRIYLLKNKINSFNFNFSFIDNYSKIVLLGFLKLFILINLHFL